MHFLREGMLIQFADRSWAVKDSAGHRIGPGNNYFASASVSVERDGLRLRAQVVDGRLECGEVILLDDLSYGDYQFVVDTDLTRLASSLTLGMFLWSDQEDFAHREIDIEAGRWGKRDDPHDMQFVVQPHTVPGNMVRFSLGTFRGPSVHQLSWSPGQVAFHSSNGRATAQQFVVSKRVPPPGGGQRVHINLWNSTPLLSDDGLTEVLMTDFSYRAYR